MAGRRDERRLGMQIGNRVSAAENRSACVCVGRNAGPILRAVEVSAMIGQHDKGR